MKAFWTMIGLTGLIWVLAPARAPDPAQVATAPPTPVANRTISPPVTGTVTLPRASDGHFYADALVNGAPVRFIVDTGATRVALTRADAARIGMTPGDAEFSGTAKGAGGEVKFKSVVLDRIAIGGVEARDVSGAIIQKDMAVSLLGQSWLKTVGTVSISGDTMTLR